MKQLISGISKKVGLIFVTAVLLLGSLGYWVQTGKNSVTTTMELNLTFTEFGQPESFDPIDADKSVNLSVMRMLYSTPLFVNSSNKLSSYVLESFDVDTKRNRILLKAKQNLIFDNGKTITANDIAMSIARFGYFHPEFPVIEQIRGLKDWAKSKNGLKSFPNGIIVNNNDIEINLLNIKKNSLFRFCLEVFSIIPIDEIDLDTGLLKVKIPSFSGPYRLVNSTDQKFIFDKRIFANFGDELIYNKIYFDYIKLYNLCDNLIKHNQVVVAGELEFAFNDCFSQYKNTSWLSATRFLALIFNPNDFVFDSSEKRIYFSNLVRKKILNLHPMLQVEASIFTKITPGFLDKESLNVDTKIDKNIVNRFKGKQIKLFRTNSYVPELFKVIELVANELGMDIQYIDSPSSNSERIKLFLNNKVSINIGGSGFWPQDPSGDIKMFFTKQLHKGLTFLWQDNKLYDLLNKIDKDSFELNSLNIYELINNHIFNQSLIAPIVHYRRLYITNKNQMLEDLPQGITSPAPWQLRIH